MFYLIKLNEKLIDSKVVAANTWYSQICKIKMIWEKQEPGHEYIIVRKVEWNYTKEKDKLLNKEFKTEEYIKLCEEDLNELFNAQDEVKGGINNEK